MTRSSSRSWILILPAALFVGILPLTHTIALRLLLLALTVVAAAYVWRREGTPVLPARRALLVWAALAIASLLHFNKISIKTSKRVVCYYL